MSRGPSPKKFWCFRYTLNDDDPEFADQWPARQRHVVDWLTSLRPINWIFQLEVTDRPIGWNPHFQGYLEVAPTHKKDLVASLPAHLKGLAILLSSTAGIQELKKYSMKTDTRCEGPWALFQHRIYIQKDLAVFQDRSNWFVWQKLVFDECMAEPDDRTIRWIYDPVGSNGKSKWGKWMAANHDALMLNYSSAENLRFVVFKEETRRIYILDATRASPKSLHKSEFYSALENIKNGMVMTGKYEGGAKLFEPPHVIVLSNEEPDWKLWSKDRLKITNLTDPDLLRRGYNRAAPYDDDDELRRELERLPIDLDFTE